MVLTGLRILVIWLLDVDPCRARSSLDGGGMPCGRLVLLLLINCGIEPM